jgi:hypothetical protein
MRNASVIMLPDSRRYGSFRGGKAVDPARQHIIADLKQDDWAKTDRFSKDEKDYNKMGFFF